MIEFYFLQNKGIFTSPNCVTMKNKKTLILLIFAAFLTLTACNSKQKKDNEDEVSSQDEEYDLGPYKLAKYTLDARGEHSEWMDTIYEGTQEVLPISFTQLPTDENGVQGLGFELKKVLEDGSTVRSVGMSVYSDGTIQDKSIKLNYNLISLITVKDTCFDSPISCIGSGSAIYDDAKNKDIPLDEGIEIHAASGNFVITKLEIAEVYGNIVYGTISGSFEFSGANSFDKNPGNVKGTFNDAPFQCLK